MNANNNINITGRLVADPELKATSEGTEYCNFRVAVDRAYVSKGEERKSDFFNCKAWRKTAAFICNYFKKGQLISLIGEMQNNPYEKDGQKRDYYEVQVDAVAFCGGKNESGNAAAPSDSEQKPKTSIDFKEIDEDDLPF